MHRSRIQILIFLLILLSAYFQIICGQSKDEIWCETPHEIESQSNETNELFQRATVSIPVVVHVLYRNSLENLSDARIASQIDVLNEDYNNLAINRNNIPDKYQSLVADMEIEFCLAHTDPDGLYTTGITRTSTTIDNIGIARDDDNDYLIHQGTKGGVSAWNPAQYLNIWVADMGGILGRSSFPWTTDKTEDGVVIDPIYFGRYESSQHPQGISLGRTATHEIGHYLGLYHLHGTENNDCNTDDMVSDTPTQASANFGCPNQEPISCGSPDMFMNFMDLSNDPCLNLFTKGQKQRVDEFLLLRSELINSNNCALGQNSPIPTEKPKYDISFEPFSQSANLSISDDDGVSNDIFIFDSAGKLVAKQENYHGTSIVFSTQNWSKGMYFCIVRDHENIKESLKLLIY